jgi:hypothetical protein
VQKPEDLVDAILFFASPASDFIAGQATTAMIYGLIFGAQIFSFFVGASALTETATAFMSHLN